MAYQTGQFASTDGISAVLQKLHDFCAAQGWVIDNFDGTNLAVHNGTTFVNLTTNTVSYTVDDGNGSGNRNAPDYRIDMFLADSYPSVLNNQERSTNTLYSQCNDLIPPYSKYWLFSGAAGDPPYIYMVIQKASGRFCTLMFGMADKKGVNYSGGDFLMTVFWNWWFAYGSGPNPLFQNGASGQGSDIFSGNNRFPGTDCNYAIRLGDIYPPKPFTTHNSGNIGVDQQYGWEAMFYRGLRPNPPQLEGYGAESHRWLGQIYWLGPHPINGNTPLFEMPLLWYDGYTSQRTIQIGAVPGYRLCSTIGRQDAEEIAYGNDNWIVFPVKSSATWNPEPYATRTVTSGIYGHAFKVNP